MVRERGVEPLRFYPQDPKSCASASSATLAKIDFKRLSSVWSNNEFIEGRGKVL